jgi:bifunctional DNA-binding transcriptional regulator/antitoxin component of YhaV-PrlF toxin-antitoxin module
MPADRPRSIRYEVDVEVEKRRRLGLPREVLEQAAVQPGDRMHVQVRRDGRIVLTRVADLLETYVGAIPGIADAARPPEQQR